MPNANILKSATALFGLPDPPKDGRERLVATAVEQLIGAYLPKGKHQIPSIKSQTNSKHQ